MGGAPWQSVLTVALLACELFFFAKPFAPVRVAPALRAQNSTSPSAARSNPTLPPSREVPTYGTPWAPCTDTSPYMKERLAYLWKRFTDSNAGDNHAAGCVRCLGARDVADEAACESQFAQDLFLYNNFFRCMDGPGVYIDAGAHLPQHLSTTFTFDVCMGWTAGICVEADNGYASQFRDALRTCKVVGSALAEFEGVLSLGHEGASSSVKDGDSKGGSKEHVKATTLATVLKEAEWIKDGASEMAVVDFMTVDVEGAELGVLMGIPWDFVWIRYILVENVRASQDVAEFLYDQGYVKVYTIAVDDLVCGGPQTRAPQARTEGGPARVALTPHRPPLSPLFSTTRPRRCRCSACRSSTTTAAPRPSRGRTSASPRTTRRCCTTATGSTLK